MTLTAAEHRQVQEATRRRRNALARARRQGPALLVRVLRRDGSVLLTAQSRSEPGAAYELVQVAGGAWACSCLGFRYRGTCRHLEAVNGGGRTEDAAAGVFHSTPAAAASRRPGRKE